MRIVIDLQAAQGSSRWRGMGRYSLWLALAMVRNRGDHEIIIALSDQFPDTIEDLRASFDGLLPQENIRVWSAVSNTAYLDADNDWRRKSTELVREAFLASLRPDIVHVSSLFEGYAEDFAANVGALSPAIPTAVTLFDLIPFIYQDVYLRNERYESWYFEKIAQLRRADLWLGISESSRREGIAHLGLSEEHSVNISSDVDPIFCKRTISANEETALRAKYGLLRPFVMYTGGIDHRKNFEGLIRSFANLESHVRNAHQLAIVCSASKESLQVLERLAADHGIEHGQMILTGYVPDDDLVDLYNLCALFVFPSWHEGFGLPALEAMRCGVPVIGADTSSLPEVIGWHEALFDPRVDVSITEMMHRGLTDEAFRARLIDNAATQSAKFSWDRTALCAIGAMERLHAARQVEIETPAATVKKPRMAFVSPLPPARSGIADYSAELLAVLAAHYEIDVIVDQDTISDKWILKNCAMRDERWLLEHAADYDRVLYQFGNSPAHNYMFNLLKQVPGVVVLHDFYLSSVIANMDRHCGASGMLAQELYRSHGYLALARLNDVAGVIRTYPCSLGVAQDSLGIIVHSQNSVRLAQQWFGDDAADWAVIPLLRDGSLTLEKNVARASIGFAEDDFVVCTFGFIASTKLNNRLVDAWFRSTLSRDPKCHLVFVGALDPGEYGDDLLASINRDGEARNIRITGWTDIHMYRNFLGSADVGVQLRAISRGETSASVLDCMNFGMATIANANGSMAELPHDAVLMIPDDFTDDQLVAALERLHADADFRKRLGSRARETIASVHDPVRCAAEYKSAIDRFYRQSGAGLTPLLRSIAEIPVPVPPHDIDVVQMAEAVGRNVQPRSRQRQLLVDISELVARDTRTGIQRVVRSILLSWLSHPLTGYRLEPVYLTPDRPYRYARKYISNVLEHPDAGLSDDPVDFAQGDIFVGLDLQFGNIPFHEMYISAMRRQGVQVIFVVYDLLLMLMPQYFFPDGLFPRWLKIVTEADGAVCISKSVADELATWVAANGKPRKRPLMIDWFHLGADVESSSPSRGVPANAPAVLNIVRSWPSFLMVGTIEPRKGHAQALAAFELLWRGGQQVNLVIVGQQGWMTETLMHRLRTHPELGKRLFWLEGISDEYLEKVYAASACLIAASEGEGFGLPLIEAARHSLPMIARDIPVFREVAGDHAFYFGGLEPSQLADAITAWLRLYNEGAHPGSAGMPWLTWEQSAAQLLEAVLGIATRSQRAGEPSRIANAAE